MERTVTIILDGNGPTDPERCVKLCVPKSLAKLRTLARVNCKRSDIQNFFDSYGGIIESVEYLTNGQTLRVSSNVLTTRLSSMFSGVSMPFNSMRKLVREENLTKISLGRRQIKRVSLFSDLLLFGKEVGKRGIVNVDTSTEISKISIAANTDELRLTIKFGNKQATFMTPSTESQTAWTQCINEAKAIAAKGGKNSLRTPRRSTYDSKQLISTIKKEEPRPKSFDRPKSTRFEELFGKRFGGQLINKTDKSKLAKSNPQIRRTRKSGKPPTPHRPRSTRFEELFGSRFGHAGLSWHDNRLPNVLTLATLKQEVEEAENQVKELMREVAHLEQGRVRRERQIKYLQSQLPETVNTLKDLRRKSMRLGLSLPEGSDSSSEEENEEVTYLPPDEDVKLTPMPEEDLAPPTPGEDDTIWESHSDEDLEDFEELDTPTPAALSFDSLDRIPDRIDVMDPFIDSATEITVSAPVSEEPFPDADDASEDLPLPPTDVPEFIEVDGMRIRVVSEAKVPPTHDPRYSARIDSWEAAQFAAIEDLESKALEAIQKEDLTLAKQFQSQIGRLKAAMPVPDEEITPRPTPDTPDAGSSQRAVKIARMSSKADASVFLARQQFEDIVRDFITIHDEANSTKIKSLLHKYRGNEMELYAGFIRQYGACPKFDIRRLKSRGHVQDPSIRSRYRNFVDLRQQAENAKNNCKVFDKAAKILGLHQANAAATAPRKQKGLGSRAGDLFRKLVRRPSLAATTPEPKPAQIDTEREDMLRMPTSDVTGVLCSQMEENGKLTKAKDWWFVASFGKLKYFCTERQSYTHPPVGTVQIKDFRTVTRTAATVHVTFKDSKKYPTLMLEARSPVLAVLWEKTLWHQLLASNSLVKLRQKRITAKEYTQIITANARSAKMADPFRGIYRADDPRIELLSPVVGKKKAPPPVPPARRTLPRPPAKLERRSAPPIPGRKDKKPLPLAVRTLKNNARRSRQHASSMPDLDLDKELPSTSPSSQAREMTQKNNHVFAKSQSATHINKKSNRKAMRLKKFKSTPATTEGRSSTDESEVVPAAEPPKLPSRRSKPLLKSRSFNVAPAE